MTSNPGNVNRHLGGRKAARTRATNDHHRQFGYPTYDDSDAWQKRLTRPIRKSSRAIQPTPKIVNGKQACPVCDELVSVWGFGAHYNMKHTAKTSGGIANVDPATNKPSTGIRANDEPVPTIPTNNNNTTTLSAQHQNCVNPPKFETGDRVMLNGFGKCTIRTSSVERKIVDVIKMPAGWFYKATNGTNTKGNSYHCYPERRLTMVEPTQQVVPDTIPSTAPSPATPRSKSFAYPFPNVRTRRYNLHPELRANTFSIRTRY